MVINPDLDYFLTNNEGYNLIAEESRHPGKDRIVSMDAIKGFSILLIILAHISWFGLEEDLKPISHFIYLGLQVFGGPLFIFMTSVGVSFSLYKKRQYFDETYLRRSVYRKALMFYCLSLLENTTSQFYDLGYFSLWKWSIFQSIALAQLITYFASKFQKYQRVGLAFIAFYLTPIVVNIVTQGLTDSGIDIHHITASNLNNIYCLFYYILLNPLNAFPFFPNVAIPFIGSITGEAIAEISIKKEMKAYRKFSIQMLTNGIILMATGILTGLDLKQDGYYGLILVGLINKAPYFNIPGIPEFLIQNTIPFMFYSIGLDMLILAGSFYVLDIKKNRGWFSEFLSFFGMVSLSMFILHNIFVGLVHNVLNVVTVFLYTLFVWIALFIIMRIWIQKTVWSFEGIFYIIGKGRHITLFDGTELHLSIKEAFQFTPKKILGDKKKILKFRK